jgi:hypothetical protein
MNDNQALLLLFVKHPTAGQTKTRLAAGIGHAKALAVYRELLAHLRQQAEATQAQVAVFYGNQLPAKDLWTETGWPRLLQQGDDLGARMQHAFAWGFDQGYRRVVLVGSDIPSISHEILDLSLQQLDHFPAVIGPSDDGGYYLIGLSQPVEAIFQGKTWSTPSVLSETLADFAAANLSVYQAPTLNDIDTVDDLPGTFLAHFGPDARE